jgi:hypothetical protein
MNDLTNKGLFNNEENNKNDKKSEFEWDIHSI